MGRAPSFFGRPIYLSFFGFCLFYLLAAGAHAATFSQISPKTGTTAGGTSVFITGTGFTGATEVRFDGVPVNTLTVHGTTNMTVTTPAHAGGAVTVSIDAPSGNTNLANGFTYFLPPTITGISPTFGGTLVTITGTNFTGATAVRFAAIDASSFTVVSDTQITATTSACLRE